MAARDTSDNASVEDLKKEFDKLRDDVSGLTEVLSSLAKGKAVELGERGRESIDDALSSLKSVEHRTAEYVRASPLQALLLAAAVGLVVGLLNGRR